MDNMNTIILSAGQGTRLRPHTDELPKCMVPLAGKPLLHWQLETLRACGINENIVVVGGYRADKISAPGTHLIHNQRYATTNMVATLFCAREFMLPGKDLLITYGDIVFEPPVLATLLACNAEIAIAADLSWRKLWELRMDDPLSDAETFRMDSSGRILELGKKPGSYADVQAQYMGLIKVRGDCVAHFTAAYDTMDRSITYDGKNFDNMYMTSYIQHLIDSEWEARAALVDNGWLEVDATNELEMYQLMADTGRLDAFCKLR
jgi:choline kinase